LANLRVPDRVSVLPEPPNDNPMPLAVNVKLLEVNAPPVSPVIEISPLPGSVQVRVPPAAEVRKYPLVPEVVGRMKLYVPEADSIVTFPDEVPSVIKEGLVVDVVAVIVPGAMKVTGVLKVTAPVVGEAVI